MGRRGVAGVVVVVLLSTLLVPALSQAWVPNGYRHATTHERRGINRAVRRANRALGGADMNNRFAWLILRRDNHFGIVCGHIHRHVFGYTLERTPKPWQIVRRPHAFEHATRLCHRYARHN